MRVALYARVSTREKDQNPETQLRPLREQVAGPDVQAVGEFVDRASADDLRGRRRWRELLALARRRQVDLIVVWRLDRAFRSVLDGASTLQDLRAWGCGLRSLQEPWIDTTTPIGEAMFHITIAWAGMERARQEGKAIGRPRRRPLTEEPRFARIRELVLAGHLTRAEAARRLHVRYATLARPSGWRARPRGTVPRPGAVPDSARERYRQARPGTSLPSEKGGAPRRPRPSYRPRPPARRPKGSFPEARPRPRRGAP